jgi:MGT family glycosyltransferase
MHLGLVCPEMTGHLNPSLALGRAVARRGHRVCVITSPSVREKVLAAGLEFEPIAVREHEEGAVQKGLDRLAKLRGAAALFYTGCMLARASQVFFRDVPAILDRRSFDGLILDQVCPAAAVLAERRQLPYVVICNALPVHYDPLSPPPPTLWRYRTDLIGRVRNRITKSLLPPVYDFITGAKRAGVSPLMLCFATPQYGLAHIAQQPAFFDFPRVGLPAHFHYSGPWHEAARDDGVDFPWDWLDGRPLVYASLGTIQNGVEAAYRAMAEAVRDLDVQLVIALGGSERTLAIDLPKNVLVIPYAPQLRLLKRAAAAITHAGYNTAIECLAHGVPMVCLPVTNDQPGVARRVEWIGAGEVLPIGRVNAKRLRTLLVRVLNEPTYREAALRCRDEIQKAEGATLAAEIIERAFASGKPVLRTPQPAAQVGV